MGFEEMVRKVVSDESVSNIPVLYIVHLMVLLDNLGYLKEV